MSPRLRIPPKHMTEAREQWFIHILRMILDEGYQGSHIKARLIAGEALEQMTSDRER